MNEYTPYLIAVGAVLVSILTIYFSVKIYKKKKRALEAEIVKVFSLKGNAAEYAVKRSFHKCTDLALSSHYHSKYTGHNPSYRNGLIFRI